jgi:ABC-type branched-subunit amino acid transport system substrate-binding protein
LVDDLHVPAIIGPNTSQDTLDVSKQVTVAKGTLVISPTAQASSIADLVDEDLTWQMIPNDLQRIALMIREIGRIETRLREQRKAASLKLAVIYRDDALGEGTFLALNSLQFNGKALADPANLGTLVRIWPYPPTGVEPATVESARQFAPDVVVLIGTTEAVVQGMVPLERGWTAPQRPEYVLIESSKTPELLAAVSGNADLRHRVRGTGALPAARSARVNEAFVLAYASRHMDEPADLFGMSQAYDAMYAVAFGIAAVRGPVTGRAIARTLPLLASGGMEIELLTSKTQTAFRMLAEAMPLSIVGATAPLRWDADGAVVSGTIELWCIAEVNGKTSFESSGLSLDLASQAVQGQYTQCP